MVRKQQKLLNYMMTDFGRLTIFTTSIFFSVRTFSKLALVELIGVSNDNIDPSHFFHNRKMLQILPTW